MPENPKTFCPQAGACVKGKNQRCGCSVIYLQSPPGSTASGNEKADQAAAGGKHCVGRLLGHLETTVRCNNPYAAPSSQ